MSKSYAESHRDHRPVDDHAQFYAELLGQHIRSARLLNDRSIQQLAPQAGLTAEEWILIEAGQLPIACEQVLMLGMVLHIGRTWMRRYLLKLWAKAWGDK